MVMYCIIGYITASNDVQVIRNAIADFNTKTCVKFVERTSQSDYVNFQRGSGCWSWIGKTSRGAQELSLGSGCVFVSVIVKL